MCFTTKVRAQGFPAFVSEQSVCLGDTKTYTAYGFENSPTMVMEVYDSSDVLIETLIPASSVIEPVSSVNYKKFTFTKTWTTSGTYTVKVRETSFDGCEGEGVDVLTVTVNDLPSVPTGDASQVFCGSATVANLDATSSENIYWYSVAIGGSPLSTADALSTGNYYAEARNATTGCVSSSRLLVAVTINPLPDVPTGDASQAFCGSATVANLVATSSETIYWYTSATGGSALSTDDALSTGTYYAEARNTTTGCVSASRLEVSVVVMSEPIINVVTASNTTCETSSDGQISIPNISTEFGSTVEYSVNNGSSWQASSVFSGLSAATYQVKIRTEVGGQYCESETKSVTVNSPTAITISKSNLADASCAGNADGEIEIAVSGGDQAMYFDGSDSYVALDLNYNSTTAIPEMTVAAWVKVGPNSGGGNWAILDFDRSDYFNFTIGSSYSDYNVSFNTRSSSGGVHDFNSTTTIGDDQWHFVVGVYNSTGKYIYIDGKLDKSTLAHSGNALGSTKTRYAFIGDGSEASAFDGNRNKKYFKGNISDVWYFESAVSDTDALQELSNGIVPAGHTAIGHWDLNDITNEYIPNLANSNSYGQIFGMDNSNIEDANIYTFTCTKDGAAISLDGILSEESTGNYKLVDLEAGDYVLTATDNNGCSATTSFTIGEPEELDINLTANSNPICEGESVEITATCSGGTAAYTYEFYLNGSTTPIVNGADFQISGNKLTSSTFVNGDKITVKVTDNNSCEKVSDEVIVTVHDLPTPTISGALSVCAEDPEMPLDPDLINTEIYFTETGMSNYNWTVTGGTIEAGDGTNEITVKWKTAGTGTVSVNYENTNGCSATSAKNETITIYERPNPSSIFPDN